jgi:hypothetical protein
MSHSFISTGRDKMIVIARRIRWGRHARGTGVCLKLAEPRWDTMHDQGMSDDDNRQDGE